MRSVNHGERTGMGGIITVIIASVEVVVDDDGRIAVIAERTPTDIIGSTVPVNPCRSPAPCRNPVPTQACPPVPTTIVSDAPSPGIIGNPGPADDGIPHPTAAVIGSPAAEAHMRNPHVAVRSFVHPAPIVRQFRLIIVQLGREVGCRHMTQDELIPRTIPLLKRIPIGMEDVSGIGREFSAGGENPLPLLDQ